MRTGEERHARGTTVPNTKVKLLFIFFFFLYSEPVNFAYTILFFFLPKSDEINFHTNYTLLIIIVRRLFAGDIIKIQHFKNTVHLLELIAILIITHIS